MMKTILEHYKRFMDGERLFNENQKQEQKKKVKLNNSSYKKQVSRQSKKAKTRIANMYSKEKIWMN